MSSDRVADMEPVEPRGRKHGPLTVPEHVRMARDADGAMVLDVYEGQVYQVNLVASRILELLMEGLDETGIAGRLAREFEIAYSRAEADVREFLEILEKNRLTSRNTGSLA
jgi:hypothetical protein